MLDYLKQNWFLILIIFGLFFVVNYVSAHPGRTDRYGCHTCRTNCPRWGLKYGEYVCHRSKGLPQSKPSVKNKKLYYYEKTNNNNYSLNSIKFMDF